MSSTSLSRAESVIRVVLKLNEDFNRHDVVGKMRLMSADCTLEPSGPALDDAVYSGKENVFQFWQDVFANFPGPLSRLRKLLVLAFAASCAGGTNGAGKKDHVLGVELFQVKNDSICELLSYVKR